MTDKLSKPTRHAEYGVIRHIAFVVPVLGILFAGELTSAGSDETPEAPVQYAQGKEKFQFFCAECHGQWAEGTEQGPPLLHVYYVEGHITPTKPFIGRFFRARHNTTGILATAAGSRGNH